jgi:hypothetical protein
MAKAGYREQLGNALDERDHERLEIGHASSFVMTRKIGVAHCP